MCATLCVVVRCLVKCLMEHLLPAPAPDVIIEVVPDLDAVGGGTRVIMLLDDILNKSGSYPPHETTETLLYRLGRGTTVCFVDEENGTSVLFDVQAVAEEVFVIYWLPRVPETENNKEKLPPVFGRACEVVMDRWPGSGDWTIYGFYPGEGDTNAKREQNSLEMVQFWLEYLNSSPAGRIAQLTRNPQNPTQWGPMSRVEDMANFGRWVTSQRGGP